MLTASSVSVRSSSANRNRVPGKSWISGRLIRHPSGVTGCARFGCPHRCRDHQSVTSTRRRQPAESRDFLKKSGYLLSLNNLCNIIECSIF
jgi:hypothetical protein